MPGYGDQPSSHWLEIVPQASHPAGATVTVGVAVRDIWSPARPELIAMTPPDQTGPTYSDLVGLVNEYFRTRLIRTLDDAEHLLCSLEAMPRIGGKLNLGCSGDRGPERVWHQ